MTTTKAKFFNSKLNEFKTIDVNIYPELKNETISIYAYNVPINGKVVFASPTISVYGCVVEMLYRDYKNNYPELTPQKGSYNPDKKTAKFWVPVAIHENNI